MDRHLDEELKILQEKLLNMASLIENIIDEVITALNNYTVVKDTFEKENMVNKEHLEIDEICLKLLALYQPTAIDLRFICSTMKINAELERIGDQAVNISQNIRLLLKYPQTHILLHLPEMAKITKKMLKDSIYAFVNKDVELAQQILLKDSEVDKLKHNTLKEVIQNMDKSNLEYFISLLLISRHLEKIADHSTNISEDVIFLIQGKDIRHFPKDHLKTNNESK